MPSAPQFSLLLPVYAGDSVERLRRAFASAVIDQTLRPDQVVVVRDGPVSDTMAACLQELQTTCPVPMTVVGLERNEGLGPALDAGLAACRYDVVARMDADDVAMPHRFEVQVPLMRDADIVGAALLEFRSHTTNVVGRRVPPIGEAQIAQYARLHDPFNHPTVVYRRVAVIAAGGYGSLPLMEDYWLFARMIANGAKAVNVAEPLVFYRVDAGGYKRRGGMTLLRSELQLQRRFRDEGFISGSQYVRNVVIRGGYRLIPWWVRRDLYRMVVSTYGKQDIPLRSVSPAPVAVAGEDVARGPVGDRAEGSYA